MQVLCQNFKAYHCSVSDRLFYLLCGIMILASAGLCLINFLFYQYSIVWLHESMWFIAPLLLGLFMTGCTMESRHPRSGMALTTFSIVGLVALLILVYCAGVATTPYPLIDESLSQADEALNFSVPATIEWVHQRPVLHRLFDLAYESWTPQTILVPFLFAWTLNRAMLMKFMNAIVLTMFIGGMVYYFVPACGPITLFDSPYFPSIAHLIEPIYDAIHQRQEMTHMVTGFVAFPSFHTVNGVLFLILVSRLVKNKIISLGVNPNWRAWLASFAGLRFMLAVVFIVVLNVLLITSTLMLGHHYILDVLAGAILALGCWQYLPVLERKLFGKPARELASALQAER